MNEPSTFTKAHGLSDQLHSEFKTDLDMERLPSGKFATNALITALGVLAYNILRYQKNRRSYLIFR